MIYDTLSNLGRYRGLSDGLDTAISFLETVDLAAIPMGKTVLNGERVYVNHFDYTTAPQSEESLFEAHERYLDLHVVVDGRENMALAPVERLSSVERREEEDSEMYRGSESCKLPLEKELFALLYPGEGHLPKLISQAPCLVNKLVFKIAI